MNNLIALHGQVNVGIELQVNLRQLGDLILQLQNLHVLRLHFGLERLDQLFHESEVVREIIRDLRLEQVNFCILRLKKLSVLEQLFRLIFAKVLFLLVKILLHFGNLLLEVHLDGRRLFFHLLLFRLRYLRNFGGRSLNDFLLRGFAIGLEFGEAAGSLGIHPVVVGRGRTILPLNTHFLSFGRPIRSIAKSLDRIHLQVVFGGYHFDVENVNHGAVIMTLGVPRRTLAHRLVVILEILKFGGILLGGLQRLKMSDDQVVLRQIINLSLNLLLPTLELLQLLRETYRARLQGRIVLVDLGHFLRDGKDFFVDVDEE